MTDKVFEITHDSLAAKIWEKVTAEEKGLMEVQKMIADAYHLYKTRRVFLSKQDIAYLAPYEARLQLTEDVQAFIRRSKEHYRNQKFTLYSLVAGIFAVLIAGLVLVYIKNKEIKSALARAESSAAMAKKKEAEAQRKKTEADTAKSRAEKARDDLSVAVSELNKTKDSLIASRAEALSARAEALRNLEIARQNQRNANIAREETFETLQQTDRTLALTKLLVTDPTKSLLQSVAYYPSVKNKELQHYLRQNAYDAFDENNILYEKELTTVQNPQQIAVRSDGKLAFIGNGTSVLHVWDYEKNTPRALLGHFNPVTHIFCSPYTGGFISVEKNREAIFWDRNGKYDTINRFKHDVLDIGYLKNGREMIVAYKNGTFSWCDLHGNEIKYVDKNIIDFTGLNACRANAGFDFITISSDNNIRIWKRKSSADFIVLNEIPVEGITRITASALSPDARLVSFATDRGQFTYKIHKPAGSDSLALTKVDELPEIDAAPNNLFISDNHLFITGLNNLCYAYNLVTKKVTVVLGHAENAKVISAKNAGSLIFTTATDTSVKVWNTTTTQAAVFGSKAYYYDKIEEPSAAQDSKLRVDINTERIVEPVYKVEFWFRGQEPPATFSFTERQSGWKETADSLHAMKLTPLKRRSDNGMYNTYAVQLSVNGVPEKTFTSVFSSLASRTDIVGAWLSNCRRFILIIGKDYSLKHRYYKIYPTFSGIEYLIKDLKLIN